MFIKITGSDSKESRN